MLAVDTRTSDTLETRLAELPRYSAFFLPWAGIEKTQLESINYADLKAAAKMARLYDETDYGRAAQREDAPATVSTGARVGTTGSDQTLPRPATYVRNADGRRGRRDAHAAGVDGTPRHPDDNALRRLRPRAREAELISAAFDQTAIELHGGETEALFRPHT
jgi:hypothetical protein